MEYFIYASLAALAAIILFRPFSKRHRWSKWETFADQNAELVSGGKAYVVAQRRTCSKCNQVELRKEIIS